MTPEIKKALKQALEALKSYKGFIEDAHILEGQWHWINGADKAIAAVEQALAQPVQEPVATVIKKGADRQWMSERLASLPDGIYSLYTTSPAAQRQWVELTELQLDMLVHRFGHDPMKLVIELTQELKENNNGN